MKKIINNKAIQKLVVTTSKNYSLSCNFKKDYRKSLLKLRKLIRIKILISKYNLKISN